MDGDTVCLDKVRESVLFSGMSTYVPQVVEGGDAGAEAMVSMTCREIRRRGLVTAAEKGDCTNSRSSSRGRQKELSR